MVGSLACGGPVDASIATARPDYNDGMEEVAARHPLHRRPRDAEYGLSRSPSQPDFKVPKIRVGSKLCSRQ